ncbi:Alpha-amylase precursor [compost metagenome]
MAAQILIRFLSALLLVCSWEAQAQPRTVFVQMFEWPWKDIARECELYLGPAGFSAVQVSPPHEHIMWKDHPWWERYQVVSYQINSRSGTQQEFVEMITRCRQAGVDIYVDAVLNHMSGVPGGKGFAKTSFSHYDYPGLYSNEDFHHCGRNGNDDIVNYSDRWEVQNCELLDLADLATEKESVQNKLANYLNHLLDLGVAGFRIDAAKHIPAADLVAIKNKLKRSAYIYNEMIHDPRVPIEYAEYLPVGDVMAYDYAFRMARAFREKNPDILKYASSGFPDSADSIVFMTNHDTERLPFSPVLSYNGAESDLYRLAQIFMLAWPFGYPQVYSGFVFNHHDMGPPLDVNFRLVDILNEKNQCRAPWTCEHRLPEVAAMVGFRNKTDSAFSVSDWWSNGRDALSFSRGSQGFVAINWSHSSLTQTFKTSMKDGVYCNIIGHDYQWSDGRCSVGYKVENGSVRVTMPAMSAFVLLKETSPQRKK